MDDFPIFNVIRKSVQVYYPLKLPLVPYVLPKVNDIEKTTVSSLVIYPGTHDMEENEMPLCLVFEHGDEVVLFIIPDCFHCRES